MSTDSVVVHPANTNNPLYIDCRRMTPDEVIKAIGSNLDLEVRERIDLSGRSSLGIEINHRPCWAVDARLLIQVVGVPLGQTITAELISGSTSRTAAQTVIYAKVMTEMGEIMTYVEAVCGGHVWSR